MLFLPSCFTLLFNALTPPQETAVCAVLTAGHSLSFLCHVLTRRSNTKWFFHTTMHLKDAQALELYFTLLADLPRKWFSQKQFETNFTKRHITHSFQCVLFLLRHCPSELWRNMESGVKGLIFTWGVCLISESCFSDLPTFINREPPRSLTELEPSTWALESKLCI